MAIVYGSFPSGKGNFKPYLEYSYSQNVSANQTRVDVTLGLYCNNSYAALTWSSSGACVITGHQAETVHTGYDLRGHSAGEYVVLGSTYFTYGHNDDGTCGGINLSGSVNASSTGQGVGTVSTIFYPPTIPRASTVDTHSFTVYPGGTTTMTYHINSASSGFTHQVEVFLPNNTSVRTDWGDRCYGNTLCSYTFTASERDIILNSLPNSNKSGHLTTRITTRDAAGHILGTSDSWLEITVDATSAAPVFTSFSYADSNSTTVALTGSSLKLIKGYSTLTVTIPTYNKATATTGASISKYILSCGDQSAEAVYSSSATVTLTLPNVQSGTFQVAAVDSRGNQKRVSKTAAILEYEPPVVTSMVLARDNGVDTKTKLSASGEYWNGTFQTGLTNVVTATYRWKASSSSSWSSSYSVTASSSGKNLTINSYINGDQTPASSGFSTTKSFEVELTIKDKLTNATTITLLNSGVPVLDLYRNGTTAAVGVNKTWEHGALDVNGDIYGGENGQFPVILVTEMGSSSNGQEGWIKMSSGLMIQWGRQNITTYENSGYVFRLQKAFTNMDWTIIPSICGGHGTAGREVNVNYTGSVSTCNLWFTRNGSNLSNSQEEISYIAFGLWK